MKKLLLPVCYIALISSDLICAAKNSARRFLAEQTPFYALYAQTRFALCRKTMKTDPVQGLHQMARLFSGLPRGVKINPSLVDLFLCAAREVSNINPVAAIDAVDSVAHLSGQNECIKARHERAMNHILHRYQESRKSPALA